MLIHLNRNRAEGFEGKTSALSYDESVMQIDMMAPLLFNGIESTRQLLFNFSISAYCSLLYIVLASKWDRKL
jgi:hypothetical protein